MTGNTINPNLITTFVGDANTIETRNKAARGSVSAADSGSWYEAMSRAWGQTLDAQAGRITELSDSIGSGNDQPSQMIALTAESLRMQFMSNNATTSQNSVGQALETLGKRQ